MPATDMRMEYTAGLGRKAEVWVNGRLLEVCDGVSGAEQRCRPGRLEAAKLAYMTEEAIPWPQAVRGNPSRRRQLEHVRGWSYVGFGRVLSVMPVVIDYGLVTMEDPNWTTDETLVGSFVRVQIDRLELVPAHRPDYPAGG